MTDREPPFWRTVFTDTESESGVAPICEKTEDHLQWASSEEWISDDPPGTDPIVYDCCRGPHLQCSNEPEAAELARWLNEHEVSICD